MSNTTPYNFTVGELIEILKEHPNDMPVLVSGYDSGYENFYHPTVQKIEHFPENMYRDGEFQIDNRSSSLEENKNKALILQREVRYD